MIPSRYQEIIITDQRASTSTTSAKSDLSSGHGKFLRGAIFMTIVTLVSKKVALRKSPSSMDLLFRFLCSFNANTQNTKDQMFPHCQFESTTERSVEKAWRGNSEAEF
ncbi:Uncharacterized protein Fot_31018 [Forsythia ovata]|uniref:Uncharacterized protein n=1 Tax=Forsythia ovata TaxID=205694 RepID=A0ABD1T419_9LAMI